MTLLNDYAASLTQPPLVGGSGEPEPARYDEVVGPDGTLRPGWKGLAETAMRITARDVSRVEQDIARSLADDGVTYARPGDPAAPWQLDPVPLVIDAPTWATLATGLAQRAELLNALLIDLYGPRRLLSSGVLPPSLVFGHLGFSRAVSRASIKDPRPLVFVGTDLGRDQAGEWRVLADRTQAPSGIGYAMENRKVISRVLPDLYREAGIHRMEPYFAALRSALMQSAPEDQAEPRVVVLSPGSGSETAYDQAFIASILGFPLVQGSDLVVRDGWVYLRSQDPGKRGRLDRVDVILRRVDANWVDPLDLRGDSRLGVAGLVEAVRRGRVRVVNGLGSGVLENPGLLPFMPALCEELLGEPLRLQSLPTWWCGDAGSVEEVLDRWADGDEYLLRAIDGPSAAQADLSPNQVRKHLLHDPHRYVVQQRLPLSQAPTWQQAPIGNPIGGPGDLREAGTAVPRPLTLRAFTVRYGSAYRPLIGGLASVVEDGLSTSSKDVWVIKGDAADLDQGLADVLPMASGRASTVLVPRILEDMFWVGRYAERSEDMLRMVLAAHTLSEEFRTRPRSTGGASLTVMMSATHRLAGTASKDLDQEFRSLLLDRSRRGSVAHALAELRESLSGVRDQLSLDTWRVFGATDRAAYDLRASERSQQVADSAGRMLSGILSLQGVTASMMRDSGWRMIGIGRSIERALQLCHLLGATTTKRRGIDVDRDVLDAVLVAAESSVTHRRTYRGYVRPGGVLELLLLDPANPRSLAFGLAEIAGHLEALPSSTGSTRPERLAADLAEELAETDVATLVAIGGEGRPNLQAFLTAFIAQLGRLANAVADVHFASGPGPQAFGELTLVDTIEGLEP